ncbi:MAG: FtsX-like permease family protein [Anaerolineae bacterium]
MLSPRWRKILRDMWNNKTRTILVVLSIAIGVFAVGVIVSAQMMLANDLSADYEATQPSSGVVFMPLFDQDLVDTVASMKEVRLAEGRRSVSMRMKTGADQWRTLELEVIDKFNDQKLNKVVSESGEWPPPDKQMLVERASIALTGAQVGDKVTVEMPDGKLRDIRIAGLVHDLFKAPAQFTGTPNGYITMDTLEWLGYPKGFNQLRFVVNGDSWDKTHIEAVAEEVRKKIEKGNQTVSFIWIPTPHKHPADDAVQPMLMILAVMGGLSLFLSAFLVVNTISALLTQQIRQIGIMKAIGARTPQIAGLYLGAVLIFGLLALCVAIPLGAIGSYAFVAYMASLINFNLQGFRIPATSLVLQITIGLLVPILAALWPISAGARITVREALSTYGMGKGRFGASWTDRIVERVRGFSRPTLISIRNTFRRKARLALTLFTLTLGGAVFVAVLSVHASLFNTLDDFFRYFNYDLDVNFTRPYRTEVVQREALTVPGITAAEVWGGGSAQRVEADGNEGRNMQIIGLPADTQLLQPKLLEGRWLLPNDENAIVINTSVNDPDQEPDVKVGDDIKLKMNGRESTWHVVGRVQGVLTGPLLYTNRPYYERVTESVGRAQSIQVVTAQHDLATQNRLAEALKQHYKDIGVNVSSTDTVGSLRQNIEYQFNILVVFLAIMAVLLAIVGGLGLMGTMSINVLERTREIGVMRAVGASDGSVLRIFLFEGVFIGLLSWALGTLLALPISQLMSQAVGIAFLKAPLSYVFSVQGALIWLGLVIVLAAIASLLPSWNASRLTVRDVLAYE